MNESNLLPHQPGYWLHRRLIAMRTIAATAVLLVGLVVASPLVRAVFAGGAAPTPAICAWYAFVFLVAMAPQVVKSILMTRWLSQSMVDRALDSVPADAHLRVDIARSPIQRMAEVGDVFLRTERGAVLRLRDVIEPTEVARVLAMAVSASGRAVEVLREQAPQPDAQ